jgi:hypothetical protein
MNSKTTWIWVTLAALLFAAVVVVEKYGRPAPPELVALLPGFRASDVTSVQFAPAGQMEIRAERTNDVWQLVKPNPYPAQAHSIEILLTALERLAPAHVITGAELLKYPDADEQFGFNVRNTLTLNSGAQTRQLLLGTNTAPGDEIYVRVIGVESVFVVDANLLRFLPTRAEDWRDTALLDLRNLVFDRVIVSNRTAPLQLQREATNGLWRLVAPMAARADNQRLQESLQQLQTARVKSFVVDDANPDPEVFGFHAPELELTFAQGTNALATLQFGQRPATNSTLIYARRLGSATIVAVERQPLEPWLAPLNEFRDPRLVTPKQPVDSIEIRGPENFTLQRASTNAWRLVGSEMPVDAEAVGEWLLTLVTAPIRQYRDSITEAELPKYGLHEPTRRVILRSASTNGVTNSIIAEFTFGGMTNDLVYVRRSDENPVYAIGLVEAARLSQSSWQFRQRQLWRFEVTDVARVILERVEQRIELRRSGTNTWTFAPGSQGILKAGSGAVEETILRYGDFRVLAWVGRGAEDRGKFGFGEKPLTLTLELNNGTKHTIEFGGKSVDDFPYAAVLLDGQSWIFEFPPALHQLTLFALPIPGVTP